MKRKPPRMTKAEAAYVRDVRRVSPFEKLDRGEAEIVAWADYPEPLKRFIERERKKVIRVALTAAMKRRLEKVSRATGVAVEDLARRWIEQGLMREAG